VLDRRRLNPKAEISGFASPSGVVSPRHETRGGMTMRYGEILEAVERKAGIGDRYDAERTVDAVLRALCDRLTGGEADDLMAQLPSELRQRIPVTRAVVPMTPDEFVQRVARELQVPQDVARERIRAVFAVLRQAVTRGEFDDVLSQLDPEYADLLA
jgi:uncharacterized protein (DUF2267 family)